MKAEDIQANRFVLDLKSAADLRLKLKQDPQGGIKAVAQQFEGLLMQMLLKSMRDATPQDGVLDSDQTRFFTSLADQQLAQSLAARGALGFAKVIEKQLGRNLATPPAGDEASPPQARLDALQRLLSERQAASSAASSAGLAETGKPREAAAAASATGAAAPASASAADFVNRIWPHVVQAAKAIGVPPQFIAAHSALESGWGKSEIRTADGAPSYNVFGVKAGSSWQGRTTEVATTEYVDGVAQPTREKFRVYASYAEAFRDYASLLTGKARFAGVLGQQAAPEFARSLQQSGYATDPMYADKLTRIINGTTLRQALIG